jgi:hypothetical protein
MKIAIASVEAPATTDTTITALVVLERLSLYCMPYTAVSVGATEVDVVGTGTGAGAALGDGESGNIGQTKPAVLDALAVLMGPDFDASTDFGVLDLVSYVKDVSLVFFVLSVQVICCCLMALFRIVMQWTGPLVGLGYISARDTSVSYMP